MKYFRFRLRTLMVLFSVIGVAAGLVGTRWHNNRQRELVVAEVKRLGGMLVGAKTPKTKRLFLAGKNITDKELAPLLPRLRYYPELRELDLVTAPVTDKSLRLIVNLRQLELLHVYETDVTDKGLEDLQLKFPELTIKQSMPDPVATTLVSRKIYRHAIISLAVTEKKGERTIVTGDGNGEFRAWEPEMNPQKSIKAHDNWTFSAEFNHRGNRLATGGGDNLIRLWDTDSWKPVQTIDESFGDVHAMAFSPDDRFLYSVGDDMIVRRFDLKQQPPTVLEMGEHDDTIPTLSLDTRGRLLATGSRDDTIRIWNAVDGQLVQTIEGHDDDVVAVAFHPTKPWLLSASYDKTVRVWDVATGKELNRLAEYKKRIFDATWGPAGNRIATAAEDGVRTWDANTLKSKVRVVQKTPVAALRFSPDGQSLWFVDADGFLAAINPDTGRLIGRRSTSRLDLLRSKIRIRVSGLSRSTRDLRGELLPM